MDIEKELEKLEKRIEKGVEILNKEWAEGRGCKNKKVFDCEHCTLERTYFCQCYELLEELDAQYANLLKLKRIIKKEIH